MTSSRPSLPRWRRGLVAVAALGATTIGAVGLAPLPAAAAPEQYTSAVEGNIAVKGQPSVFDGVTIAGTYDAATGALTAKATFPDIKLVREDTPAPGTDAEVVLGVSQPNVANGTITSGQVSLDAQFAIVVKSVTLIDSGGNRTPLPLGPSADSCRFAPINVALDGTATGSEGGPLAVAVSDDSFVIPPPPNQATDCGALGGLLIPEIAGPASGEDPNSAELSFTLSSAQAIVESLYQTVLGRSPEPTGLAYWTEQLGKGVTPTKIAISIAKSREGWRSAITDSYRIALARDPEPAGLQYWTETLLRSQDQRYLIGYLYASPEADALGREAFPSSTGTQAYVQYLYDSLFDRAPSAADLDFWVKRIEKAANQNVSRKAAADFFFTSAEIRTVFVNQASLQVCETPASGAQRDILRNAFVASKFQTRVLLAVATVTPCPAPI